jgi:beta-glucosidase
MKFLFAVFISLFSISLFSQPNSIPESIIAGNVDSVLSLMTLQEKIGQMTQAERGPVEASGLWDIQQHFLGSVLSGGGSAPSPNTPEAWVSMYNNMQSKALSTRLAIPLIYGVDAVHGHNNLKDAVIFPHNIGLGCTRNPDLVEQCARITALEVMATGLNWTFSPCVAVPQNEFWGRTYEGFGESTSLVDSLGKAAVAGYQTQFPGIENSILSCAKHFIADGGTLNGIDQGNAQIGEDELREIHLPPYVSAIEAGVGSVMISFSSWNGAKCHGSSQLINELLKDELGFQGFVLSDWKGIDQVNGDFKMAIKASVNAGIDMAMQPDNYIQFIDLLTQLVNEGQVPMERIDDAVSRILTQKFQLGLFDNPYANTDLTDTVGCDSHREVARQAVRESLVILKNDGLLPMSKNNGKILVAGSKGNDVGALCGGWTISWQGSLGEITEGTTVYEGIAEKVGNENVVFTSNPGQIPEADYAVVVVGENPYAEGSGDIYWTNGSGFILSAQDKAMVQAVKNNGIPMVVLLISGRPLDIRDELDDTEAFIAAWLPGSEGGAGIADILFGDYFPSGKLSHTWPESFSDVPLNINGNYPGHEALFPYGHGLEFTTGVSNDFNARSQLKVYPNPVTDYVFIRPKTEGIRNIIISDIIGNNLVELTVDCNPEARVYTGHLSPGIYILTVSGDGFTGSKKIIRE